MSFMVLCLGFLLGTTATFKEAFGTQFEGINYYYLFYYYNIFIFNIIYSLWIFSNYVSSIFNGSDNYAGLGYKET